MTDTEDNPLSAPPRRIRLPSPGTLCAVTLLAVVGYFVLSIGVRAHRNLEMIQYVEGRGGKVEMEPLRPEWVRQLLVKVAGEDRARAAGEIVGVSFRFSETGLHRLHEIPGLRKLTLEFTPATAAALQQLSALDEMETLSLAGSALDDDEMEHLSGLTQLRTLDLTLTNISDEGLAQLGTLRGLRRLHLGHDPQLSDEAIADLRTLLPECEIDRSTIYAD